MLRSFVLGFSHGGGRQPVRLTSSQSALLCLDLPAVLLQLLLVAIDEVTRQDLLPDGLVGAVVVDAGDGGRAPPAP